MGEHTSPFSINTMEVACIEKQRGCKKLHAKSFTVSGMLLPGLPWSSATSKVSPAEQNQPFGRNTPGGDTGFCIHERFLYP